jgi:hypothetical protein
MFKFLCKSLAVSVLVISNLVFFLLGVAITGLSVWIHESNFSRFFMANFIWSVCAAGIVVMAVSILGMCGACSQKKRYLAPYLFLVLACVGVQLAAVVIVTNYSSSLIDAHDVGFNSTAYNSATSEVMDWLEQNTEYVYDQAQCSPVSNPTTGDLIICASAHSNWFETFVNEKCSADTSRCADATSDSSLAFCLCQNALTDELDNYSQPVLIAALGLITLEALLLVFVVSLCCIGRHKKKQAAINLDAPLHQQPAAQFVYVQHSSIPPAARNNNANAVVKVSQGIDLV